MADTLLPTATVAWRAIAVAQDQADPGATPQEIPLAGLKVRLTPSPRKVEVAAPPGAAGPTTYTLREWSLETSADGTLVNPEDPTAGPIQIVASDAIPGVVIEWTSTVDAPDSGVPPIVKRWLAPAGSTIDLTTVVSVPPPPSPLPEYLAAVADARAARDTAVTASTVAVDAASRAEVARDGIDGALAALAATPRLPVASFGVVDLTGTADSTAAFLGAVAEAQRVGGVVELPRGVLRIDSQLVLAQTGGKQKSVRITGQGRVTNWATDGGAGGSVLDLRYSGPGAKIETYGQGVLEIDHLTLTDRGSSSNHFLLTTGTTLHAHDIAVVGNPGKSRETCDQDVFILGGLLGTTGNNGPDEAFQGYGSVIERVLFEKVRTGVLLRRFANSVIVRDNSFSNRCGSTNDQAAIEFNPGTGAAVPGGEPAAFVSASVVANNLIEVYGYRYGIRLMNKSERNLVTGNAFWDVHRADYAADIFIDTNARSNVVIGSTVQTQGKHLSDLSSSTAVFGMLNLPGLGDVPGVVPGNAGFHLQGSLKMPNSRAVLIADSAGTYRELLQLSGSNQIVFGDVQGALSGQNVICRAGASSYLRFRIGTADKIIANASGVGFQGSSPIAKPAVSGSRADGSALASLLTALASYGLISDSTTA